MQEEKLPYTMKVCVFILLAMLAVNVPSTEAWSVANVLEIIFAPILAIGDFTLGKSQNMPPATGVSNNHVCYDKNLLILTIRSSSISVNIFPVH